MRVVWCVGVVVVGRDRGCLLREDNTCCSGGSVLRWTLTKGRRLPGRPSPSPSKSNPTLSNPPESLLNLGVGVGVGGKLRRSSAASREQGPPPGGSSSPTRDTRLVSVMVGVLVVVVVMAPPHTPARSPITPTRALAPSHL